MFDFHDKTQFFLLQTKRRLIIAAAQTVLDSRKYDDDIVSDVALLLQTKKPCFSCEKALNAYLYRAATRIAKALRRKHRREVPIEEHLPEQQSEAISTEGSPCTLDELIHDLSDDEKLLLDYLLEPLLPSDISERMGITETNFRQRKSRLIRKLKTKAKLFRNED